MPSLEVQSSLEVTGNFWSLMGRMFKLALGRCSWSLSCRMENTGGLLLRILYPPMPPIKKMFHKQS